MAWNGMVSITAGENVSNISQSVQREGNGEEDRWKIAMPASPCSHSRLDMGDTGPSTNDEVGAEERDIDKAPFHHDNEHCLAFQARPGAFAVR